MTWKMEKGKWKMDGKGGAIPPICHFPFTICHRRNRRAFSFAEVMFAVVILGVGFIMVAAIFPVAIQQTQTNTEESAAASIAKEATATVLNAPQTAPIPATNKPVLPGYPSFSKLFPPTVKNYIKGSGATTVNPPAVVAAFSGSRWDAVKSNIILPHDPRYGYALFYRREQGSSTAQLIVIGVTTRARPVYDTTADLSNVNMLIPGQTVTTADFVPIGGYSPTNAGPPAVPTSTTIYPDQITVNGTATLIEGCTVAVRAGGLAPGKPWGRTYRLGRHLTNANSRDYELEPGDNMCIGENGGAPSVPPGQGIWGTFYAFRDGRLTSDSAYVGLPCTFQPRVAYATLSYPLDSVAGRISLFANQDPATVASSVSSAVQGTYVIVADDYPFDAKTAGGNVWSPSYPIPDNVAVLGGKHFTVGELNGRIFRLGAEVPTSPGSFDLDPVYGMTPPVGGVASVDTVPNPALSATCGNQRVRVYIIGAGSPDPKNSPLIYSGAAQDIAVYTTFFSVQ